MKRISTYEPGGYYVFESTSCGRNCYFENSKEIALFERLLKRYLSNYVLVHKLYTSSQGYHLVIKVRTEKTLLNHYINKIQSTGKAIVSKFKKEPWRIVSEQVRIFHSVYAKLVNKLRGRQGGLVQSRFKKYHFSSKEEFEKYVKQMDKGKEVESQRNERYKVSMRWKEVVDWGYYRKKDWVEKYAGNGFPDLVVSKLISLTKNLHSSTPFP